MPAPAAQRVRVAADGDEVEVPIFDVYYDDPPAGAKATPEIALNDAAAIFGKDPLSRKPAQTVENGKYVDYRPKAPSLLHYLKFTGVDGWQSVKDTHRQQVCPKGRHPFMVGGKPGPTNGRMDESSCDEYP